MASSRDDLGFNELPYAGGKELLLVDDVDDREYLHSQMLLCRAFGFLFAKRKKQMTANTSKGSMRISSHLPVTRKEMAGVLSYPGIGHKDENDLS